VNRNFPPDHGATGFYAQKLTDYLLSTGLFDIHVVSISDRQNSANHTNVRGLYSSKVKWKRMFSTFYESWKLIHKALKSRADIYLILTDPPFLNFWASKLLKQQTWVLWTMDLYPDAFLANNLISKNNYFYSYYVKVLRLNPPAHFIALGENQAKYLIEEVYSDAPFHVSPVGLQELKEEASYMDDPSEKTLIVFGYVGSIGEAHDELLIIECIKQLDPEKHRLILSCYGSKAKKLKKAVENLTFVQVAAPNQKIDLSEIDVHIVSLSEKWTHICVPSKALSAIEAKGTVLFFGRGDSDTWQYVKGAGWLVSNHEELNEFIKIISPREVSEKRKKAYICHESLAMKKERSFQKTQEIFLHLEQIRKTKK